MRGDLAKCAGRFAAAAAIATAVDLWGMAHASPWGQPAGNVFVSSKVSYFLAKSPPPAADATGSVRLAKTETDLYGEVGLGRGFTGGGKVVYGSYEYFDGYESSAGDGFTEGEAFLQKSLFETPEHVLAIRVAGGGEARRRFAGRPLSGGGGAAEIGALYGRTFAARPFNIFASAEAGYRHRFGESGDQVRGDVSVGVGRGAALLLLSARSTTSIGAARAGTPNYDLLKLEASLIWRVSRRWSVQAGALHEAAGDGVVRGEQAFVGLWSRF